VTDHGLERNGSVKGRYGVDKGLGGQAEPATGWKNQDVFPCFSIALF
jgi:hypothetical protein